MRLLISRDAWEELQHPQKVDTPVLAPSVWPSNRRVPDDYIVLCDTHLLERIEHLEAHLYEGVARSLHQPGPEIARSDMLEEAEAFERWKPSGGWNMDRYSDDDLANHFRRLSNMLNAVNNEQARRHKLRREAEKLGIGGRRRVSHSDPELDKHLGGTDGSSREATG